MVSWEAVHSSSLMDGGFGATCGGKKNHDPSQTKVINRGYYKVKNIGAKEKE